MSNDVNNRIEEQLGSHDILLYMKGTPDFPQCGFSGQAVAALNAIGRPYAYVNIFEDPDVREGLKVYSNWPTFPQLYVKGELIGGSDIVVEMFHSGELKSLIEEATPAAEAGSAPARAIILTYCPKECSNIGAKRFTTSQKTSAVISAS